MTDHAAAPAGPVYYPGEGAWIREGGKVYLIGSECPQCRKKAFPQRSLCDACGFRGDMTAARLGPTGTLYSFSELHVAPAGFPTPYVVGYVDFPGDVRVFGQIEHPVAELEVDDPVELVVGVIRTRPDGSAVYSYKFRKTGG